MRINTNMMALNTHRQLSVNNANVAKSTEKLSSGLRINRAGDDAAGLAISEKMRAQIRGLTMASKNSEDAISLVQTAEGALTETHSILQRMRELAVQSASDTNADLVDRVALNEEFTQLRSEINDIATLTKFNDQTLLDGNFGVGIDTTNSAVIIAATSFITVDGLKAGESITLHADDTANTATVVITSTDVDRNGLTMTLTSAFDPATLGIFEASTTYEYSHGLADVTLSFTVGGADLVDATDLDVVMDVVGSGIFQTGANTGDELQITIGDMSASALGLTAVSVNTQLNASSTIDIVNNSINSVSAQRSKLGALQNRLDHKINNLDASAENLLAAESRIRDLDMAKEMTAFTSNNILVKAATSMLAQANSAPQNVLTLLQ